MSFNWIDTTLGQFIDFKNGKTSPQRNDQDPLPVFGSNGVIGFSTESNAPENCLIIGRVGSYCGSVYHSVSKCWITDNAIIGLPKIPGESEFWYFLLSILNLNSFRSGSGQPLINQTTLNSIPIKVPDTSKVRSEIGKKLHLFNEKIELNNQINQTLEQMAQALYKSWFVDFEPVKAKMAVREAGGTAEQANLAAMQVISGAVQGCTNVASTGRAGATKTEAQLEAMQTQQPEQYAELKATAELFPDAMQESELGDVPEGWSISEIGKEVDVVGGGTPSTKVVEYWESGNIHWTTPKDLSNLSDKILINTERKITKAGLAKISSGLLPIDTVLMSSRAPVGYLALAKVPVAINQGYIAMKCNKVLTPVYVLRWADSVMDEIKQRASGTTFAEISKANFRIIKVIVPDEKSLLSYTKAVNGYYEKIAKNLRENQTLTQLRDTLLPKLLSGEITVTNMSQQKETT